MARTSHLASRTIALWRRLFSDSLLRNSAYLMLSTLLAGALGFFFWTVASRFYSPRDVGLATSTVSAVTLLSGLSMLGYHNAIIRFLSRSGQKHDILSTGFSATTAAAIVLSVAFVFWEHFAGKWFSHYEGLFSFGVTVVAYTCVLTINTILESAFIAFRSTKYVLQKNAVMSALKLPLPIILVGAGFLGIVDSVAIATGAAVLIGFLRMRKTFGYRPAVQLNRDVMRTVWRFSAGNYVGNVFSMAPATVVPLIVLSQLGAKAAAYFYMPLMIVTMLNVIPSATAQSVFAEMSHDQAHSRAHLKKAIAHTYVLMAPAVLGVMLLGSTVLSVFGEAYVEAGATPLAILALASLIGAANFLGDTLLKVQKRVGLYMVMNAFNATMVIGPAFLVAHNGLVEIAWSVLFGQLVTLLAYLVINRHIVFGHASVLASDLSE